MSTIRHVINGSPKFTKDHYHSNGDRDGYQKSIIPTVEEAIPYSPFSSIVPFDSDLLPMPSVGLRSSVSIFNDSTEQFSTRNGLEFLNREAADPKKTSEILFRSLHQLKELLHPAGITRYKFKSKPRYNYDSKDVEEPLISLSPFSQMILDNTVIGFSNSTSIACTNSKSNSGLKPKPSPAKAASQQLSCTAARNHQQNLSPINSNYRPPQKASSSILPTKSQEFCRKISDSKASESSEFPEQKKELVTDHQKKKIHASAVKLDNPPVTNADVTASPLVFIPLKPPKVLGPENHESIASEKQNIKRESSTAQLHQQKAERNTGKSDTLATGCDERKKADNALHVLQEFLQDIFEEEDQFEPSTPSQLLVANLDGGVGICINAHMKLDRLLQGVIQLGRFSQVQLDDLTRIQRLCEGPLRYAESIDVSIDESMKERDLKTWSLRLSSAELGLRSARTALRLMAGGREEMQLYSVDIIQSSLKTLQNIVERCIVPIVEMRNMGNTILFKQLIADKIHLLGLLKQSQRLLFLTATLVTEMDLSDGVLNALEYFVSKLFFVENASTEKESFFGIYKFDGLRTAAMEVLSRIFASKPAQRRGIFTEFLTSLEKLPVSKQNARQFKLADVGNIQHASVLIMRLIQISATKPNDNKEMRRARALGEILHNTALESKGVQEKGTKIIINSESKGEQEPDAAKEQLGAVVNPLMKAAKSDATYVIEFIVARATNSTKGNDSPFRHLLDLFVQDFISCIGLPDWPAAELLLRLLLFKMIEISKSTRSSSLARNIALDMLSQMGPKISELHFQAQKMARSVEYSQSELSNHLSKIVDQFFERETESNKQAFKSKLLSWDNGPFRTCIEFLESRSTYDSSLNSAIAYMKVDWATKLLECFDYIGEMDGKNKKFGRLAFRLREMINDSQSLSTDYSFNNKVTSTEIRLAHTLVLLGSPFCQYLDHILSIFLTSMNSGQAMVQAKSLKCLTQLLDTDPGTIDRHPWVKDQMVARLEDVSSSVRENALGLISKLISLRPSLESDMVPEILKRLNDANVSVRKRAIKLSKEVYMRNYNFSIRVRIAKTILWKTGDDEPAIQELVRQTIEEIWFSPLYYSSVTQEISPQHRLDRAELVSLMVETIETPERVMDKLLADKLDKVLTYIVSPASKFHESNSAVCKALVENMFETVIDNSSGTSNRANSRIGCFHILQVFATSKPKLFTTEHIQILHPYVANLSSTDNAAIYNSVVRIFKQTLSHLPDIQEDLLVAIRNDLLKSLAKLRVTQLDDVIACVSIISRALQNFDNLTRVLISALETINKLKLGEIKDDSIKKLSKLLPIVGLLGKHCDFDSRRSKLAEKFPRLQHDSVPKLITDTISPLASPSYSLNLRKAALQAIGYVCFTWPNNFSYANVFTSFEQVFDEKQADLEIVVMEAFKLFLLAEERRSGSEDFDTTKTAPDLKAKLGVMGGSQSDGIALGIAQRFLLKIITVALRSKDDKQTFLAAEIIASVARQGLVHPKQTGVALITLGTSSCLNIAKLASEEHIVLHAKHETLFERDYMTAVQTSFDYQRDVVNDTRGAWLDPGSETSGIVYCSKLSRMFQVLNDLSKPKTRKKFLENLCSQLDRNKPRKDITEKQLSIREETDHIKFSQFVIENIAFFEYKTIDELIFTIHAIEQFVSTVGADVAHNIEQEILQNSAEQGLQESDATSKNRHLTTISMTLALLWETRSYLRNQYNIVPNRREGKIKNIKDLLAKPSKASGVNGDMFWQESTLIMRALESEKAMKAQCQKFVELLHFDRDLKVAAEGDDDLDTRNTPDSEDNNSIPGTPSMTESTRVRKRKISNLPVTPSRKKRYRSKCSGKRVNNSVERSDNESGYH
ncbi:sister chromatid cohesion protein Mis4 [Blumeria hordei DH14]|uniref:Sister chromatid cohesion protein n=1 Tax=Blumeria graminis f. sp. hordei (strain DH14) TaxID=546991 RepID=N1J6L4_BLUG1|nr:sister chromatid cohesion protein Mis4 [Blumeria hordei DH14]